MRRSQVWGILALLAISAITFYGWRQYHLQHPNREHPMTELTKNMRTVCIGRYLVDIPANAELSFGDAFIEDIKVTNEGLISSDSLFMQQVRQREIELRQQKHESEGTRLREALDINEGKQRLFVYREDADDVRLSKIETSVHAGKIAWKINSSSSESYIQETKSLITKLASRLRYREPHEVPVTPGLCIENGLIAGSDFQTETWSGSFNLKNHATTFGIVAITAGKPESRETLWSRMDRTNALGKELFNTTLKPIRRAEIVVDGRKGQEYVSLFEDATEDNTLDAEAEIFGNGTLQAPGFELRLTTTYPKKPIAGIKPLSQDEALALWDAVLKSIRPRPSAF